MWREVVYFIIVLWSTSLFSTDTELRLYRPMTQTPNHPQLHIVAKKTGECAEQSHRIKREDAWHCVADNQVYDPCFVQRFGTHLEAVCLYSPWSTKAIQIVVNHPLDETSQETLDMSTTFPWAVELNHGERCYSIESKILYDHLPVRYRCDNEAVLIGHVQRCDPEWKMLQHNAQGISTVEIIKAWF